MTPADALALVVRTAAAVSWPVHEGARLAVLMIFGPEVKKGSIYCVEYKQPKERH